MCTQNIISQAYFSARCLVWAIRENYKAIHLVVSNVQSAACSSSWSSHTPGRQVLMQFENEIYCITLTLPNCVRIVCHWRLFVARHLSIIARASYENDCANKVYWENEKFKVILVLMEENLLKVKTDCEYLYCRMSKLKRKTIRNHENFHVKFYDDLSWKASRSEKQFSKVSSKSVNTMRNNNRERKCAKTANDVSWASAFANLGPRYKSL